LAHLAPELAATLVSVGSDLALVLNEQGVIQSVSAQQGLGGAQQWVGRRLAETVTGGEDRRKIDAMVREALNHGHAGAREVNHTSPEVGSLMTYTALRLGSQGPVLAVGRDLGAIAAIQKRFVEQQHAMEREYWQRRQAEAHQQQLHQVLADAAVVVAGEPAMVVRRNQTATRRWPGGLQDSPFVALFAEESAWSANELVRAARARAGVCVARGRAADGGAAELTALALVEGGDPGPPVLIRMRRLEPRQDSYNQSRQQAEQVIRSARALAITDATGRLLMANPALHDLLGRAGAKAPHIGSGLGVLPGAPAVLPSLMLAALHQGIVSATVHAFGTQADLEITLRAEGDQPCLGIAIDPAPAAPVEGLDELHHALALLLARVGQTPLPHLLNEATQSIERELLLRAIQRVGRDRKALADWLGISMESAGIRLRRHGLDVAGAPE
jgi:transcriptional regulator PpsR